MEIQILVPVCNSSNGASWNIPETSANTKEQRPGNPMFSNKTLLERIPEKREED